MLVKSGALVSDRYRLEEPLASGGMGTVWRALHIELDSQVALKMLSPELLQTPSGEKRFRREAQAAAKLRSSHIVKVIDYGVFEGQPFLVMELLRGTDLATRLAESKKLPPDECLAILDAVAKALQVAHDAGIIHRDLKPANIFLEQMGDDVVVKVLDFGIAKDLRSKAASGTTDSGMLGSPCYMSPEQVWGDDVSVRTDTWAMAVVAYELLTGVNPFQHDVLAKVFDRIVKAKIPSAREHTPELPEGVDVFFEQGLARDPADRFPSAKALADGFRKALGKPSASVEDPAPKTNGIVWGAIGIALVLVIAFAVFRPRATQQPEPEQSASPVEAASAPPPAQPSVSVASSAPSPTPSKPTSPVRTVRPAGPKQPALDPKWGVPVGP
jgi:serine/threonine-protein kinase